MRFDVRSARLARERAERNARRAMSGASPRAAAPITRDAVLEAIARGKARRESLKNRPR
jgi:electron transport complex protein RnfB